MATFGNPTAVISPPPSLVEVDDRASQENDELVLDLASVTSSVLDYEFENGRRYHAYKAGSYPLPNDEEELDRIDLKHHVFRLLCSGHLHLAPLESPKIILDLGTGTGIWAMEMADHYPESVVIGTDLSPVQPTWVPDNVRFEIDDFESILWPWRENYFDYIHSRFLISSVSDYPALIGKAFKHCRPGGYFELQELNPRFYSDDGTLKEDSKLNYWSKIICDAAETYNRRVPHHEEFRSWFTRAGFEEVTHFVFKSPSNPWPKNKMLKEAAKFQLLAHLEGMEGVSVALLTRALEWKLEEVQLLMAQIRPELKDKSIHSYQIHYVIFGRKPDLSEFSPGLSRASISTSSSLRTVPSQDLISTLDIPNISEVEALRQRRSEPAALASVSFSPVIELAQPTQDDVAT